MDYMPRETYNIYRSRNKGKFWSNITPSLDLSESTARAYMETQHQIHPSDWLRLIRTSEEVIAAYGQ